MPTMTSTYTRRAPLALGLACVLAAAVGLGAGAGAGGSAGGAGPRADVTDAAPSGALPAAATGAPLGPAAKDAAIRAT